MVALSVDGPAESQALRTQLRLEFPILCDTQRSVVRAWDLYNARERGGIAVPAVFVIERDRRITYRSIDATAARVRTDGVLEYLHGGSAPRARAAIFPRFGDWVRAIGNALRRSER